MKKLFFILFGLISFNAYSNNCGGEFQASTGTCRIIGPDGNMILYNSTSPQTTNIVRRTVRIPPKYGAIAWSKETGLTVSYHNFDSLRKAKRAAIRQCEKDAQAPCQMMMWVKNGCTAIAAGTNKFGRLELYPEADKRGQAEKTAIKSCHAAGSINCKITGPEDCSIPE